MMKTTITKLLLLFSVLAFVTPDISARRGGWGGGWGVGVGVGGIGVGFGRGYYGRGWYGGYPYYAGYYGGPYYGGYYSYPYYSYPAYDYYPPVRRRVIKRVIVERPQQEQQTEEQDQSVDNANFTHWTIRNTTKKTVEVQAPDNTRITILPGHYAQVANEEGWDLTVKAGNETKQFKTQTEKPVITVSQDTFGRLIVKDE